MNVNENVGRSKDELCNRCEAPWVTINAPTLRTFISEMSKWVYHYQLQSVF
jgi:hypothetical protein